MYNIISPKYYLVNLFIIFSIIYFAKCNHTIESKGWSLISKGWPLEDKHGRQFLNELTTYYYIHNFREVRTWILPSQFQSGINDTQIYKFSFKYWSSSETISKSLKADVQIGGTIDSIFERYYQYHVNEKKHYWMPVQYILSGLQLKTMLIHVYPYSDELVAFKDIKLEYETKTLTPDISVLDKNFEVLPLNESTFLVKHFDWEHIDVDNKRCFQINYNNQEDIELNVVLEIMDDPNDQIIFTYRPKYTETTETLNLCLEDLLAIKANNFNITFNIKRPKNKNNFYFEVIQNWDQTKDLNSVILYSNEQNFLTAMKENKKDEWHKEWSEVFSTSSLELFTKKSDHIQFYTTTQSLIRASAHLMSSVWIKNDDSFYSIDSKYSIEVKDNKTFDNFIIRPKVCDQFSHCVDVIETGVEYKNYGYNYEKKFKLNSSLNSTYIKLQFYVEYFKPSYIKNDSQTTTIDFNLKLIHFGDPCNKENECKNSGICESNPKSDKPNDLICDCDDQWEGNHCDKPNYCRRQNAEIKNGSGGYYCHKNINGSSCQNLDNGFQCNCGVEGHAELYNIIWNKQTFKCEPLTYNKNKTKGWANLLDEPDYITSDDNKLVYHFENIDTNKNDVCFDIAYGATKSVNFATYYSVNDEPSLLFDINLKINPLDQSIKFCVGDFVYEVNNVFDIYFEISLKVSTEKFDENTFKLFPLIYNLKAIDKKSVAFIESWVNPKNTINNYHQKWNSLPLEMISKHDAKETYYSLTFKNDGPESLQNLLISNWITYDESFVNDPQDFKIEFSTKRKEFLRFNLTILYQIGNKIITESIWNDALNPQIVPGNTFDAFTGFIKIPKLISAKEFKLIFKINKQEKAPAEIDINIKNIKLGDPCYSTSDQPICKNDKNCSRLPTTKPYTPNCDCGTDNAGKFCDIENQCIKVNKNYNLKQEEVCKFYPNGACQPESGKCSCHTDYEWVDTQNRCVRKIFYNYNKIICEAGRCDLFNISRETKWWDKSWPDIVDENILPFNFTNEANSQLTIKFLNETEIKKSCIKIQYQISSLTAGLQIIQEGKKVIELRTLSTEKDEWIHETIYPNRLSKNFGNNPEIILKPRFVNLGTDALSLKVEKDACSDEFSDLKNEFDFLEQTNDTDKNNRNKWPVFFPQVDWNNLNNWEFIPHYTGRQTAILISNWIRHIKDINEYKLRFKIFSDHFEKFKLEFEVYNENMFMTTRTAIENEITKDKKIILVNIDKVNSTLAFFRVAIKINYKIDELLSKPLFRLDSMDLGDHCVSDEAENTRCHNGKCIRVELKYPEVKCDCGTTGYSEESNCRKKNWCNFPLTSEQGARTGKEFCEHAESGHCEQFGLDGWRCNCTDPSQYWVYGKVKKCIPKPKCIFEDFDPNLWECSEVTNKTKCKLGLLEIGSECVKYDVCNETHREQQKHTPFKPCQENGEKAKCYPTFKNEIAEKDDYMCICKQGYETIHKDASLNHVQCNPLFCELPSLNNCAQKCKPDDDKNFTCDPSPAGCQKTCPSPAFCDYDTNSNEMCICRKGFEVIYDENNEPTGCKPDTSIKNEKLCPNGQTTIEKDELICNCGNNYELNDKKLCELKPICAENSESRKDCDHRNKLCFIADSEQKGYFCGGPDGQPETCPHGMIDSNKFCISKCKYNHREEDCARIHAICQPEGDTMKDYCQCKPGFTRKGQNCVIGRYTLQFNLKFKLPEPIEITDLDKIETSFKDLQFVADLNGYHKHLRISHEINKKRLKLFTKPLQEFRHNNKIHGYVSKLIENTNLFDFKNTLGIQRCDEIDHYYHCSFTLKLDNKVSKYIDIFHKNLTALCTETGHNGDCFFAIPKTSPAFYSDLTDSVVHIVSNTKDLGTDISSTFKACADSKKNNISPCQGPADCEDSSDKESSLFTCTCNNTFFDIARFDYIPIDPSIKDLNENETRNEYCQIKTKDKLCGEHCFTNEKCTNYNVSIRDPDSFKHFVPIQCNCEANNKRDISTKLCVASCMGIDCGNGKCEAKGEHWACVCDDKYSGINCQTKLNEGGWIAAVAVLAVVVAILCGVAIFFARRKRSLGINSPSTRQLDDFSDNTSYRNR